MPTWWEHFVHAVTGRPHRHLHLPDLRHLPSRRISVERTHYLVNDPERRHQRRRLYVIRHSPSRSGRRPRIAVYSNGRGVGYLPEPVAHRMSPLLATLGGAAVVNGAGAADGSIRLRVDLPTHTALTEFAAAQERDERMTRITWHGLEAGSVETCTIEFTDGALVADSVVDGPAGRLEYRLETDARGQFRSADLTSGGRNLSVSFSGGHWLVNGERRGDLDGARDIDIVATPMTNTLPIRRLGLAVGESADVDTAWVDRDLTVVRDPQRYTRVGEREYLFEARDSDFRAIITVDDDGVVLDYPALFRGEPTGRP
jgi:hypothetical protein